LAAADMDLNQVTVPSLDIAQSIRFYVRLGLRLIVDSPHYARFECPVGNSTFSVHLTDSAALAKTVVYFEVSDLDQTVAALKLQGLQFLSDPRDEPWLWRESRLADPSGNEICLYTAGENRKNPPWRVPDGNPSLPGA
jgi:catechol 2,3-dioxygenase-like lactoylglutathione lyase family enzyme